MAVWVVRRDTNRCVDYSEDESLHYDDRYNDHVLVPAGSLPAGTSPKDYVRSGRDIVPTARLNARRNALIALSNAIGDATLPDTVRQAFAAVKLLL